MRWLLMVIGFAMGLLVVRSFFLGPLEEIAFRVVAEAVQHVNFSAKTWQRISETSLARKFLIGGGVGAAAGFALGAVVGGGRRKR